MLTIVDLFAGAGGFSEGALGLGDKYIKLVFGADHDIAASATWLVNRPATPFLVHDLSLPSLPVLWNFAEGLGVTKGHLDLLVGSPPCQLMSPAGKRHLADEDNLLFVSMLQAVDRWEPRAFALENIPAFFNAYGRCYLNFIVQFLQSRAYRVEWGILDAASFGVPQHRKRGVVVAVRTSLKNSRGLLPTATHRGVVGQTGPREGVPLKPLLSVRDAIGDLPSLEAGEGYEPIEYDASAAFSNYQRERNHGESKVYNHVAWKHSRSMVERIMTVGEGETPQSFAVHTAKKKDYFRLAYARLLGESPSGTITTNFHNPGSGRFTHYLDNRTITPREAARLQSFDDTFRFLGTASQVSRQVGNAVPPLLARAVLGSMVAALE